MTRPSRSFGTLRPDEVPLAGPLNVALLPIGFLDPLPTPAPLLFGSRFVKSVCKRAALTLPPETGVWYLPTLPFGLTAHDPGLGLKATTLQAVIHDLAAGVQAAGFTHLLLIAFADNQDADLSTSCEAARRDLGLQCQVLHVPEHRTEATALQATIPLLTPHLTREAHASPQEGEQVMAREVRRVVEAIRQLLNQDA